MAVPEIIPIARERGHRTDLVGRFAGGQFLASITFAFPNPLPDLRDGWEDAKKLFVVLHRFDEAGNHLDSDIWCAGTWREQQAAQDGAGSPLDNARARMAELIEALPDREFGDIAIRPFQVTVDGVLFGLVIERGHCGDSGGDEGDWAELYPDRLGFCDPWDGRYST